MVETLAVRRILNNFIRSKSYIPGHYGWIFDFLCQIGSGSFLYKALILGISFISVEKKYRTQLLAAWDGIYHFKNHKD